MMQALAVIAASLLVLASPDVARVSTANLVWEDQARTDKAGRIFRTGVLAVVENRDDVDSRTITLPVKRFLATGKSHSEPIFFLTGGPGQTNMDYRPPLALLENHDIVLVGFRGVDGSVVLDCVEVETALVHTGGDLLSETSRNQLAEAGLACANRLTAEGIDLNGYTMTAVIDDMEQARKLMGDQEVNLLSASYGTRLAQIYAARYPDALHRSMMVGVNPPGRMLWDAATTDDKVAMWSSICAQDLTCSRRTDNLADTMRNALTDLPERWMGFSIDPGKVKVTAFCMLFDTYSAPLVVDSFLAAGEGDFSGLALMSLAYDYLLPPMMVWGDFFAKGGTSGDFSGEPPDFNPPGSVLGAPLSALIFKAAQYWPVPPIAEEYHTVQESIIPTLLVGGELDVSTPPEHARRQLLPSLANGQELTLPNLGHVSDVFYRYPEARDRLLTGFFLTGEVHSEYPATPPNLDPDWGLPRIASTVLIGLTVLLLLIAGLTVFLVRRWKRRHAVRSTGPLILNAQEKTGS